MSLVKIRIYFKTIPKLRKLSCDDCGTIAAGALSAELGNLGNFLGIEFARKNRIPTCRLPAVVHGSRRREESRLANLGLVDVPGLGQVRVRAVLVLLTLQIFFFD